MRAEITLTVDDTLSVVEAHAIADEAQHLLIHRVPRLDDATVHVNPAALPGIDHHAATGHHRGRRRNRPGTNHGTRRATLARATSRKPADSHRSVTSPCCSHPR